MEPSLIGYNPMVIGFYIECSLPDVTVDETAVWLIVASFDFFFEDLEPYNRGNPFNSGSKETSRVSRSESSILPLHF